MAQPSERPDRFDKPVRWVGVLALLVIALAFASLVWVAGSALSEVRHQREERACLFQLTTTTDKIDSDVAAKQAAIFEAAILRGGAGGGTTPELQRLGNELHQLLLDRTEAYDERENAAERCN